MITLTQHEVIDAILDAAAKKAGVDRIRLGRVSTWGHLTGSVEDEDGRGRLMIINGCDLHE